MNTGMQGMFSILIVLLSIWFVWVLLSAVKWDKILLHPLSVKAKMLQVVIAIALGNMLGEFILDYWGYSVMLRYFVE